MGAPRRNRKKYERPSTMWNKHRIEEEHKLAGTYGLRNLRELWKATSEIRRIRRNAREVLSGNTGADVGRQIINRLARYNVVNEDAIPDDLLVIKPESLLERRLQTLVYRKGMAKSLKQARQFITHGFIAINSRRMSSPGYLVNKAEESNISYYKAIKIEQPVQAQEEPAAAKVEGENVAPEQGKE